MKHHPAADLFPMLGEEDLRALAADIAERGQIDKAVIFEGLLLDGRNRAAACKIAKVELATRELKRCDSPTAFVLSANVQRRHLNPTQKSTISVDALPLFEAEAKVRMSEGGRGGRIASPSTAREDAAKATGASPRYVQESKAIKAKAPDVYKAMREGTVNVQEGKALASLPAGKRTVALKKIAEAPVKSRARAVVKEIAQEEKTAFAAKLRAEPVPLPGGRYRVIVIDPPWQYGSRAEDVSHRGRNPYPDMSIEEICELPVGELAEKDCILWLWTTNAFMHEAYHCLDAWGFTAKTIMTWDKEILGLGDWLRNVTEHCIIATRGRPVVELKNQTTIIREKRGKHSKKPLAFYALVDALCPGGKVEMFARDARAGWARWGAESPDA